MYGKETITKKGDQVELTEWCKPMSKNYLKNVNLEINEIFNNEDGYSYD